MAWWNKREFFPILILLENKVDMEKESWQVTQEEIDSFVKLKNLVYFATSAKTNLIILQMLFIINIQLKKSWK